MIDQHPPPTEDPPPSSGPAPEGEDAAPDEPARSPGAAAEDLDPDYPDITEGDPIEGELVEAVEVAEAIAAERDEYLDMARRLQAEFENYKRRVELQREEQRERAAEELARELLPVLDAGEAALAQEQSQVEPIHAHLLSTLEKRGLQRVVDADVPFDPNVHEAVMHEEGDGGDPVVVQVLRTGYLWNQRVLRPAMVKVRG